VHRLRSEIVVLLEDPQVRERLRSTGAEPVGSTPEQLAAKIKAETERMSKVIKAAGIRAE
jgi:tripartite-type tricarboxylate transporter receptor subunit TctC